MTLEDKIISNLVYSEEFCRKVLPFTKPSYFEDHTHQIIVSEIAKYFTEYNKQITKDILEIGVLSRKDLTQNDAKEVPKYIASIERKEDNVEWLLNETEKFYQKRAVYLAILDSIQIIDGTDKRHSEDAIPSLLQDALAVTFDMQVGHDYLEDVESRYDFYHRKEDGIPFDLELFNKITGGVGLRRKTVTCVAARTGGGKSIFMCHAAAAALMQGKNVLYISMEMSEERIAERIDANLFNTPIQDLRDLPRDVFENRINKIRNKTQGRLIVKEYPTSSAHAGHFRALIEELKTKKSFVPDMICVDYLNICASQRVKNAMANSYTIMKSIAEELRALAVEYNVPLLTATQLNRGGITSSDVEMTDTSECIWVEEKVTLRDGSQKKIADVKVGDQLLDGVMYKTVSMVHHPKKKSCYKITLASGKTIVVSADHVFPTNKGRMNIKSGLTVGVKLKSV
jgi:replicative DNA helicase